ncbi:PREDICTED: uncharacterized protein LOC105557752 [Vollenhovia emeryi]|uniref:uncharacterized protein LOC105557752 n=1 Tax=Vollenhovia emeryi TaxID=411798 RepID=UPI0005F54960|nr:PREDICTED: uncharacterized protein LOC105557752 [Vollenhovia emeryi]
MSAEELRRLRGYVKAKQTRIWNYAQDVAQKRVSATLENIAVRQEKLEQVNKEFETLQRQILVAGEFDVLPPEDQREEDEFEERYLDLKAVLVKWIAALTPTVSTEANNGQAAQAIEQQAAQVIEQQAELIRSLRAQGTTNVDNKIKLPIIRLPTFSGELEDWKRFSDTFTALIHNSELSAIQKHQYLVGALTGNAAKIVESIEISAQNYEVAWNLLKDRYEDERALKKRHLQCLFEMPRLERESATALQGLVDHVHKHLRMLKALGSSTDDWDDMLVYMIEESLDKVTRRRWEENVEGGQEASAEIMFEFLQKRSQMLERLHNSSKGEAKSKGVVSKAGRGIANEESSRPFKGNASRKQFLGLPIQGRIDEVKRLKLCFNCLRNDHFVNTCKAASCRSCSGRHNTLCHKERESTTVSLPGAVCTEDRQRSGGDLSVHHTSRSSRAGIVLMATAVVSVKDVNGFRQDVRVLLDSASEANFITKAACSKLNLKIEAIQEAVTGINNVECTIDRGCRVVVESRVNDHRLSAFCLVVPKITKKLPSARIDANNLPIANNLKLADPQYFHPDRVDMLLGGEFFLSLLNPARLEVGKDMPTLQDTKLGWIVSGPIPPRYILTERASYSLCLTTRDSLERSITKFWEIEEGVSHNSVDLTKEEQACEQLFKDTHTRTREGRFVVRLPFRDNKTQLGKSRAIAERRLMHLERKFKGNIHFQQLYKDFIKEYIELKHMTILPITSSEDENAVYLPHHGILRRSVAGAKLRVVFDASAKTSSGLSLNDTLMTGANLQDTLFSIVLRFRICRIVLTTDLQKMYRQVLVHDDDRCYQRILWRWSPDERIREYTLNTVTYGEACAPFLAIRSVQQLAREGKEQYPRASTVLLRDSYVDDVLTGVDNIDEARKLIDELSGLLKLGQFQLHKWRSNYAQALFGGNDSTDFQAIDDEVDIAKTLGLRWLPESDMLQFESELGRDSRTKCEVLSSISKLFDPLGLASPLVVRAKLIMQRTWQLKLGWDDELPPDLQQAWIKYMQELIELRTIRIPRRVMSCDGPRLLNLHAFCDASERAYGACVYIQTVDNSDRSMSRLLCARSRVAPMGGTTIPRLELCGAVVLVELVQSVIESLHITIDNVYAWSDSMIVLAWIAGDVSRQKTFVSNRIGKIQSILPENHWNHVEGRENPADLISRGTSLGNLESSSLWWSGPPWLSGRFEIPKYRQGEMNEQEVKIMQSEERGKLQVLIIREGSESLVGGIIGKISSATKMERTLAWCYRFMANCRLRSPKRNLERLSVGEIYSSRLVLIKHVQRHAFAQEIRDLSDGGQVKSSSVLASLSPFIDQSGVLRVGGRLQKSLLEYEKRHPILLPAKCRFTVCLFEREHSRMLHAGPQALLFSIRGTYWPLNGRNIARKVVRGCTTCFRNNPKPLTQIMGSLPLDRINCRRVFSVVGIDYAGPIITAMSKGRGRKTNKSYIALFICFSTKAIHLEAVSQLSSDAFVAALRRFAGRRGCPRKIYSDNATNFVGAERELAELYQAIRTSFDNHVNEYCSLNEIQWSFIPPHAPHMGGLWEAGVKSCKYHLKRVIGETVLTFEELSTVLVQIEACLNSRPLCQLPSSPNDLQPLTPAHFLIGESITGLPDIDLKESPVNRLDRWQLIQRLTQHFWKRWSVEYLTSLQGKCKWTIERENLGIDDIVLVCNDNAPPLQWKIGRVLELHPGADKKVRVVTVKTANSVIKRPITKLCKLPIDCDDKIELN